MKREHSHEVPIPQCSRSEASRAGPSAASELVQLGKHRSSVIVGSYQAPIRSRDVLASVRCVELVPA